MYFSIVFIVTRHAILLTKSDLFFFLAPVQNGFQFLLYEQPLVHLEVAILMSSSVVWMVCAFLAVGVVMEIQTVWTLAMRRTVMV